MTNNLAKVNHTAIRCFRDVADYDYIAARLSYRAALGAQFLWSAQQAIEKYLKCILVLNQIPAKNLHHNLQKALERINANLDFNIELNEQESQLFKKLNEFENNRYLEFSWSLHDYEIAKLDMLVWHLRQYCRPMGDINENGQKIPIRSAMLKAIKDSWNSNPQHAYIAGGKLENILMKKDHPARAGLIWQNARYSLQTRKTIRLRRLILAENAPLYNYPEILDEMDKLIQISSDGKESYKRLLQERTKK